MDETACYEGVRKRPQLDSRIKENIKQETSEGVRGPQLEHLWGKENEAIIVDDTP